MRASRQQAPAPVPSRLGSSQLGPMVSWSGSARSIRIATGITSWGAQNGSRLSSMVISAGFGRLGGRAVLGGGMSCARDGPTRSDCRGGQAAVIDETPSHEIVCLSRRCGSFARFVRRVGRAPARGLGPGALGAPGPVTTHRHATPPPPDAAGRHQDGHGHAGTPPAPSTAAHAAVPAAGLALFFLGQQGATGHGLLGFGLRNTSGHELPDLRLSRDPVPQRQRAGATDRSHAHDPRLLRHNAAERPRGRAGRDSLIPARCDPRGGLAARAARRPTGSRSSRPTTPSRCAQASPAGPTSARRRRSRRCERDVSLSVSPAAARARTGQRAGRPGASPRSCSQAPGGRRRSPARSQPIASSASA